MKLKNDLVTKLLPILGRSLDIGFNVFDVMHHGTHEKQLSNVFGWLLDAGGTHRLGDRFVRIFVDQVNQAISHAPLPLDGYRVQQEVNTAPVGNPLDIADLVLENSTARIVVENYFTSDGHGHSYHGYVDYSRRDGHQGAVVLLCRHEDKNRLMQGWENSHVLTYRRLISSLHELASSDLRYQRDNPQAYWFMEQLHQKFVSERNLVGDRDILKFITTMSDTGETARYGTPRHDEVAEQFASDVAVQARQRFVEGRELLQRLKVLLRSFSDGPLSAQLNASLGYGQVRKVSMTYAGIYQWTINFHIGEVPVVGHDPQIQLKFGPSAWFANAEDPYWDHRVDLDSVDYSSVFVARNDTKVLRQTTVTLEQVLEGLQPTDTRLHDEIIELLQPGPSA